MKRASQKPQSVFNTRSNDLVEFLETEHMKPDKDKGKRVSSLFPHQIDAVRALRKYFAPDAQSDPNASNIALVVLPTGCGKTGVAVLASYALNASRVLVITPSIIISRQIAAAYGYRQAANQKTFLIKCKIIEPDDAQDTLPTISLITKSTEIQEGMRSMVMVVNAHKIGEQSSVKIDQIPREGYDLVIVDEAHHYPADTWKLLVDHFCNSRRLFLTATPLHKGRPILPTIPPCYELKRSEAIKRGIIRDVKFDDGVARGVVDERQRYQVSYSI